MSHRADALADRIEQGARALGSMVEGLSDDEWRTVVPNEARTVGVLVHHVASMYPLEVDAAMAVAGGQPIVGLTSEVVAHMNAQHAGENHAVDKNATLALLRDNSKAAADRVRGFTDDELDGAATISLNADAPLTAQFVIEDHAVRHSYHHLASICAALGRQS